jgi:hypothetical protein
MKHEGALLIGEFGHDGLASRRLTLVANSAGLDRCGGSAVSWL